MRSIVRAAMTVMLLTTAVGAWSQIFYSQPYTPDLAAHESRVRICDVLSPIKQVVMDDWISGPNGGPINRVWWWGTLYRPEQAQRVFRIAIYRDNNCTPFVQQPLFVACVVPDRLDQVGVDCTGKRVYIMSAPIPVFMQFPNTHYWLEISEDDERSLRPGKTDFKWSAHRPIEFCRARKLKADGTFGFLRDACDALRDDLAFMLEN